MKKLLKLFLILLIANSAIAQNGIISGTVTDSNQTPLLGVNILLKKLTIGTQTNENGGFKKLE